MPEIPTTLRVDRPPEEVFDYFLDFRNENEWNAVAKDVRMTTSGPLGPGSKFRGQYQGMGAMEYEVLSADRPRRITTHGKARFFEFDSTFDFTPDGGGTRLDGSMRPHPKGLFRLLTPFMGGMIKKQVDKGMASLRQIIESKPRRPTAGS